MKVNWQDTDAVSKIVDACVRGDRMNQEVLYKSFYGKMLTVCMRYSKNKEEAYDILQEGFVKVFNKLKNFEKKGSLEGWIRRIMANTAIDHIRKKKDFYLSSDELFEMDNLVDDSNDESELDELVQMKADVIITFVQKLSPAYRTVFNMYVIENMTHQEIADYLNISVGTSKSNLAKAKNNLKEMVLTYIKTHEHETF
ncbi:MAG TPA: sigma-70 family RNA polymerase sigma factor [Bacteroidales bacterium]|nr:sigma-70 family RNA polymerase sigma factor [Bacteroidales bacterium]